MLCDFLINAPRGLGRPARRCVCRDSSVFDFCGLAGKFPSWVDPGKEGTRLGPGEGPADSGSAGPADAWAAAGAQPERLRIHLHGFVGKALGA